MRSKANIFFLLGIVYSIASANVFGETLIVAVAEKGKPPLTFPQHASETGIYLDILAAIGSITGDTFVFDYYPPKRIMYTFEAGKADIEMGINPAWRQSSRVPGNYTIPFAKAEDIVLFSIGQKVSVNAADDLTGRAVGTMRGYYYPGYMDAFAKGEIKREEGNDEENLLKRLLKGRYKQVFIRKEIAEYWMKLNPRYQNFEIGDVIGSAEIMIRVHPSKAHVLERFNKAIQQLKQSGQIERIYVQYR